MPAAPDPPPPEDDDATAWAVLHAFGLSHRGIEAVEAAGGARFVLDGPAQGLVALLEATVRRRRPPWTEVEVAARHDAALGALRELRAAGIAALGGKRRRGLERLDRAPGPPLCLYVSGNKELLADRPQVAVVGSREASRRWLDRAQAVGAEIARAGVTVVSGGARGVDRAAHEAALLEGGRTVVVRGDPASAAALSPRALARTVGPAPPDRWLAFSPHHPLTAWSKGLFASRNRFIAALADVVLVVSGGPRSGTRHTVEAARRLGVPVRVIPGDLDDPEAGLAHQLLYDGGARPFVGVAELLDVAHQGAGELFPPGGARPRPAPRERAPAANDACGSGAPVPLPDDDDERAVYEALLAAGPLDVDALARHAGLSTPRVLAAVTGLELDGRLATVGAAFQLTGRR